MKDNFSHKSKNQNSLCSKIASCSCAFLMLCGLGILFSKNNKKNNTKEESHRANDLGENLLSQEPVQNNNFVHLKFNDFYTVGDLLKILEDTKTPIRSNLCFLRVCFFYFKTSAFPIAPETRKKLEALIQKIENNDFYTIDPLKEYGIKKSDTPHTLYKGFYQNSTLNKELYDKTKTSLIQLENTKDLTFDQMVLLYNLIFHNLVDLENWEKESYKTIIQDYFSCNKQKNNVYSFSLCEYHYLIEKLLDIEADQKYPCLKQFDDNPFNNLNIAIINLGNYHFYTCLKIEKDQYDNDKKWPEEIKNNEFWLILNELNSKKLYYSQDELIQIMKKKMSIITNHVFFNSNTHSLNQQETHFYS